MYYAWSNITAKKDRAGRPVVIPAGSEISLESTGFSPAQFQELVEARAVRTVPYPPLARGSTMSPTEFMRRSVAVATGASDADVMAEAAVVRMPEWQMEPSAKQIVVPSAAVGTTEPSSTTVEPDIPPVQVRENAPEGQTETPQHEAQQNQNDASVQQNQTGQEEVESTAGRRIGE